MLEQLFLLHTALQIIEPFLEASSRNSLQQGKSQTRFKLFQGQNPFNSRAAFIAKLFDHEPVQPE